MNVNRAFAAHQQVLIEGDEANERCAMHNFVIAAAMAAMVVFGCGTMAAAPPPLVAAPPPPAPTVAIQPVTFTQADKDCVTEMIALYNRQKIVVDGATIEQTMEACVRAKR